MHYLLQWYVILTPNQGLNPNLCVEGEGLTTAPPGKPLIYPIV